MQAASNLLGSVSSGVLLQYAIVDRGLRDLAALVTRFVHYTNRLIDSNGCTQLFPPLDFSPEQLHVQEGLDAGESLRGVETVKALEKRAALQAQIADSEKLLASPQALALAVDWMPRRVAGVDSPGASVRMTSPPSNAGGAGAATGKTGGVGGGGGDDEFADVSTPLAVAALATGTTLRPSCGASSAESAALPQSSPSTSLPQWITRAGLLLRRGSHVASGAAVAEPQPPALQQTQSQQSHLHHQHQQRLIKRGHSVGYGMGRSGGGFGGFSSSSSGGGGSANTSPLAGGRHGGGGTGAPGVVREQEMALVRSVPSAQATSQQQQGQPPVASSARAVADSAVELSSVSSRRSTSLPSRLTSSSDGLAGGGSGGGGGVTPPQPASAESSLGRPHTGLVDVVGSVAGGGSANEVIVHIGPLSPPSGGVGGGDDGAVDVGMPVNIAGSSPVMGLAPIDTSLDGLASLQPSPATGLRRLSVSSAVGGGHSGSVGGDEDVDAPFVLTPEDVACEVERARQAIDLLQRLHDAVQFAKTKARRRTDILRCGGGARCGGVRDGGVLCTVPVWLFCVLRFVLF